MGNTEGRITDWADSARATASGWIAAVGRSTGFSCTKIWHFTAAERHYVLTIRHELSGERIVIINGKTVYKGSDDRILPINIKDGHKLKLAVLYDEDTGAWLYELRLDGERVPEFNELTSLDCDPLRVQVISYSVKPMGDSEVAMYTVESSRSDEEPVRVERRFSEFAALDALVRGTFFGNHLLSSVPALPPKGSRLLADQLNPEFLGQRREALDIYLRKLLQLPRLPAHPDLLAFLHRGILEPFRGVTTKFLGTTSYVPPMTAEELLARNRKRMEEEGLLPPAPAAAESVRSAQQQGERPRQHSADAYAGAEPDHAAVLFGADLDGREETL